MGARLYFSNDMEYLIDQLARQYGERSYGPFDSAAIVVQTSGMRRWVSIRMAEAHGIFAHATFYTPDELLMAILRHLDLLQTPFLSKEQLAWVIYHMLEPDRVRREFPEIMHYVEGEGRRVRFARRIADVFDQYSVYRPQMVAQWNAGQPYVHPYLDNWQVEQWQKYESWQRRLWNTVQQEVAALGYHFDRSAYVRWLAEALHNPSSREKLCERFPHIDFFGLATFAPLHMKVFAEILPQVCEVSFYLFNPAPEEYWYKDISPKAANWIRRALGRDPESVHLYEGNPLLMEWGKVGKDLIYLLLDALPETAEIFTHRKDCTRQSLLANIQSDLHTNALPDQQPPIDTRLHDDGSITITSHYTELREVEVLHDYLLYQIEQFGYAPHEMAVLVTDIERYAPYIRAVFDNMHPDKRITYILADVVDNYRQAFVQCLIELLELEEGDLTAENVLRLLDFDPIQSRFEYLDTEQIRRVLQQANIRYGIKGSEEDESHYISWFYGLKRILLGYMMYGGTLQVLPNGEEVLPLEMSGEVAHSAVEFAQWVYDLIVGIQQRGEPRPLSTWLHIVQRQMEDLMQIQEPYRSAYRYVLYKLHAVREVAETLEDRPVPYRDFIYLLKSQFYPAENASGMVSGPLTIAQMIPLRTIPYKVIAVLGLNRDDFPRRTQRPNFDLIQLAPAPGDRDVRQYDQYLFLETLLSAQDKLYLSFLGRSIHDNRPLPPSSVVDQLLQYLKERMCMRDDLPFHTLIRQHPIHPYHRVYFEEDSPYFTYVDYRSTDREQLAPIPGDEELSPGNTTPDQLMRCFRHPLRWYMQQRLGIYLYLDDVWLEEHEPLAVVDGLHRYRLREYWLTEGMSRPTQTHIKRLKLSGMLPLNNAAVAELDKLRDEMAPLTTILYSEFKLDLEQLQWRDEIVEIHAGEYTIKGKIPHIIDDMHVHICTSKQGWNHWVAFCIEQWLLAAAGLGSRLRRSVYVQWNPSMKRKTPILYQCPLPNSSEALQRVQVLLKWYHRALQRPLAFHPEASYRYWRRFLRLRNNKKKPLDVETCKVRAHAEFVKTIHQLAEDRYKNESDPYWQVWVRSGRALELSPEEVHALAKLFYDQNPVLE